MHVWEIICPISCSHIRFGVKCLSTGALIVHEVTTTTPRYITLTLNITEGKLSMRINGELKTDRDEPLGVNNFGPF